MDDEGVAITQTIQALGEFRTPSVGGGARDLVSVDALASRFPQRLLLAFALLFGRLSPPITPGRHECPVEYLSEV